MERHKKKEGEDKRSEVPVVNNICTTDYADVLTMQADELSIERMRFGLISQWEKGKKRRFGRGSCSPSMPGAKQSLISPPTGGPCAGSAA